MVTRSHYSIDIVAGLVFAHYFYLLAWHICEWLETQGILHQRKIPPLLPQMAGTGGEKSDHEEEAPLIFRPEASGDLRQPIFLEQRAI